MKEIILFSGTTEGRELSQQLATCGLIHHVCVASDYGEEVMQKSSYALVHVGRMDQAQIRKFCKEIGGQNLNVILIDATHPYATEVTKNLKRVAESLQIDYYRIAREETNSRDANQLAGNEHRYTSFAQCMQALSNTEGNILLTTGSKELATLQEYDEAFRRRIYVRILPAVESLTLCQHAGIESKHIIAMHGPFTVDMNLAQIKQYQISHLVTKESGVTGGYPEKEEAAKKLSVSLHVIERPTSESGMTIAKMMEMILLLEKQDAENRKLVENGEGRFQKEKNRKEEDRNDETQKEKDFRRLTVSLVGVGMGTENTITVEAKRAIEEADIIFGAKRMVEPYGNRNICMTYKPEEIINELARGNYRNAAVLYSGDTGFYSGASSMQKSLEQWEAEKKITLTIQRFPGISSVSYFAAKLGVSYEDALLYSLHGRGEQENWDKLLRQIPQKEKAFVLLSGAKDIRSLASMLIKQGYSASLTVGSSLSYPQEKICKFNLEEALHFDSDGILLVFIDMAQKREEVERVEELVPSSEIALTREIEKSPKQELPKRKLPRMLLAACHSGSGKTMVTCGLLQLFKRKGIDICSYKCGPDYIDPMFHRSVLKVPSDNLDSFFSSKEEIRNMLGNAQGEMAIAEGVMGLYDGMSMSSTKASSYEVAQMSDTPVVLLVEAKGMGRTAISLIKGMLAEDNAHIIKGILFNRISENAYLQLKPAVEEALAKEGYDAKVIGYLPNMKQVQLESRHLGLKMPQEIADLEKQLDALAKQLEKSVDFDALLTIMQSSTGLVVTGEKNIGKEKCAVNEKIVDIEDADATPKKSGAKETDEKTPIKLRLAVARDEAFCFYYQENMRVLKEHGVELVSFSPLHDKCLPENVQGLLLGGGYPELFAKALSENKEMRSSIKKAIEGGIPYLAECGGFLYLHKELEDDNGTMYPMVGVLSATAKNTGKLGRFGYISLKANEKVSGLATYIEGMKGHEFHYYDSLDNGTACIAEKPSGNRSWPCMHSDERSLAGFPHLYYRSEPKLITEFVKRMQSYEDK